MHNESAMFDINIDKQSAKIIAQLVTGPSSPEKNIVNCYEYVFGTASPSE
jgi:hypothetical protein